MRGIADGRQVQTQYGPEYQEIGGFWPGAASALAKCAAWAGNSMRGPNAGLAFTQAGISATLWQA